MKLSGYFGRAAAAALILTLSGCELFDPQAVATDPTGAPMPGVEAPQSSAASRALSDYYRNVQADLLSQGLLRTDGGGPSTPFGSRELAQNFVRIALFDEYVLSGGHLVARPQASRLRRWESPLTVAVEFGETVGQAQRRKDLREILAFSARLSRLTSQTIRVGGAHANFHILILNEDERRTYGPRLRALVPGIAPDAVETIVDMPRSTFCLVHAFSGAAESSAFTAAVVVIRAEHPDLLRRSCIHEEMAQGMGLANDSPAARPSIFNDDEEFGLLTTHDELLLRILYDRRLSVGMTEAEAAPIVRRIAEELLDGSG